MWHSAYVHIPRLTRYTIGAKIDNLFTELLELSLKASYAKRDRKINILNQTSQVLDTLKYFITILWEIKGIDTKKFSQLSEKLSATGRMLGGWLKELNKKIPYK